MRKLTLAVLCVLVLPCSASAADVAARIPFADTGSQIVSDVEAVLAAFTLSDDQVQKIAQAKQEFTDTRSQLIADLTSKFTQAVGKPEDVFAKLDDAKAPNDDKLALRAKTDKFASAEGSGFRSSVMLIEGALRRDIGRALAKDEDAFKVALNKRQALKDTPLGAYIVKVQDGLPALKLSARQQQKMAPLLDALKAAQEQSLKDYVSTFTQKLGGGVEKIRKSGTPEEKAGLDKKTADVRAELFAALQQKARQAITEFEAAAKTILTADQQAALAKLAK